MKVYELTVPIRPGMPVYPGDPPVRVESWKSLSKGDPYNVALLQFGGHTGTHVDAPAHLFVGARGVDALPLDPLIGPALVVELHTPDVITTNDLLPVVPPGTQRLLFKTRNSLLWEREGFQRDYVYLAEDAARWLAEQGLSLVGTDYLSVDGPSAAHLESHRALLAAGVVVLEGLDMRQVPPGEYTLVCLPLRIRGADGAPACAVLIA